MRELLKHVSEALERGRELIVCQVVETRGSTPQKAGALMVVNPDGGQVGTLGGGCVEAEVKQKAIRRVGQEGAEFHSFILDHDYAWADGLICGGKMVILAEALRGPEAAAYFETLQRLLDSGEGFTEGVVVDPDRAKAPGGSRALFDAEGKQVAGYPSADDTGAMGPVHPLTDRPRPGVR